MKVISRNEETILLTILKIKEGAYGVSIRERIKEDTGDTWSFASIYQPLDKLLRKNLVQKVKGEPSAARGGKSKFYYHVTREGKSALLEMRRKHDQVWSDVPQIILD